jgi:integrase/recombinase XerD
MLLIDEYRDYLQGVERKSKGTIEQYYSSVKMFCRYMKASKFSITRESVSKIKLSDIYGFLGSLKETNGNGASKNKVSALKSFIEFCKDIELVKHNIILDIKKLPSIEKRVRKYFDIEECKKLIESVGKRNLVRDKTIIILFLNTGLRLSELIKLNVNCVSDSDLTIIGKGNKERPVCLNAKTIIVLKEYLSQRPESDSSALFLSERGSRISKSAVQNLLKNTIKRAGLKLEGDTDMLVHILRRTFATLEYQNGTDLNKLKEILGHEDIGTTQLYIRASKEQMQNQAEKSIMSSII